MIVTCVYVWVKTENVEEFIQASLENHRYSIQEPGNLRFDVLQSSTDPTQFLIYEAYDSPEAAATHKQTPHYLKWKETVAPWMAKPREGVPYLALAPKGTSV